MKAEFCEERKLKWRTKQQRNARIRIALARLIQIANIAAPNAQQWRIRRILIADVGTRSAREEHTSQNSSGKIDV
jgi:hypothetical protein